MSSTSRLPGRLVRIVLAVATATAVVLVPATARGGYTATLVISPTSGAAGSTVTVTGSGHTPDSGFEVEIHWQTETGPLLAHPTLTAAGEYQATITIPGSASPGTYRIVACEDSGGPFCDPTYEFHVGAEANFTVTATTTTTTVVEPTNDDTDTSGFVSVVGEFDSGFWGPAVTPDVLIPSLYMPRCTPPEGATIIDFEDQLTRRHPILVGHPELQGLRGSVEVPPSGTISMNKALHVGTTASAGVIRFNEPQRHVGLYLGDAALAGGVIELLGFSADGSLVAVDRIDGAWARVDQCMAISVAEATIVQVELRSPAEADLYYDRLFYSGTVGLPRPPRAIRGSIDFLSPSLGAELFTMTRHVASGIIRVPEGFSIEQVMLSLPRSDHSYVETRDVDFVGLGVRDGEQRYIFIATGIYMPLGPSYLSVTATGPGVVAGGLLEVTGFGPLRLTPATVAGHVDVSPITIEVTQAIRGEVNLIAPGTTIGERADTVLVQNKRTVVRGFARLVFPEGEQFAETLSVNAVLVGTRDGAALPGSPLSPIYPVNLRVWGSREAAYHAGKQETHASWNFVLPDSWTDPGTIDLRLVVNDPGWIDEHPDFDGPLNEIGLDGVTFRSKNAPAVDIWLVDYWFRCGAPGVMRGNQGGGSDPSAETVCAGMSEGDVVNTQPTREQAITAVYRAWSMSPFPGSFPTDFEMWEYTFATDGVPESSFGPGPYVTPGSPQEAFWLGVAFRSDVVVGADGYNTLNVLMSSFIRGKAWATPSFFRTTPDAETLIHEAAHSMGLRHTPGHGEEFSRARWGGDHGDIGIDREHASAWDPVNMQAIPFAGLHDIMSYAPGAGLPVWTSWETWHHIEDAVGSGVSRPDERSQSASAFMSAPLEGAPDDEVVTIIGSLDGTTLELLQGFHLPGGVVAEEGELEIRTVDATGTTLATTSTTLFTPSEGGGPLAFIAPVSVPATAAEIIFLHDGVEVGRRAVATPPTAVILQAPVEWPADDPVTLTWESVGGEPISYRVEASRDGDTWVPIATTEGTSVTLDPGDVSFQGAGWRLRVQASTGLSLGISPEVVVDFPTRNPVPLILLPLDGSTVSANTLIELLAARASYSSGGEDGFEWRLDDVEVGRGLQALADGGAAGEHTITLTEPVSGATDAVTITVVADLDLDGMSDEWEGEHGLDPADPTDATADVDGDGLAAWQEFQHGTSPDAADTDGDGYSDGREVAVGTDPLDPTSIPVEWLDDSSAPPLADGGGGGIPVVLIGLAAVLVLGAGALLIRRRR